MTMIISYGSKQTSEELVFRDRISEKLELAMEYITWNRLIVG